APGGEEPRARGTPQDEEGGEGHAQDDDTWQRLEALWKHPPRQDQERQDGYPTREGAALRAHAVRRAAAGRGLPGPQARRLGQGRGAMSAGISTGGGA